MSVICLNCEGWTCSQCKSEREAARGGEQGLSPLEIENAGLRTELATAKARVAELEGIRPEFPPMPFIPLSHTPAGYGLPRYGLRWSGPTQPLAVPMADGYWTPWHLAELALLRGGKP